MQVPKRKTSKYSYIKPDPHLTMEKIREFEDKLERMKKKHPKLAAEVKRLALDGDFSENAGYQLAKGRLRGLNQRMLDIKNHLSSAILINPSTDKSMIEIGNTVEVEIGGKQKTFTILGSSETDPLKGIVSHSSPIGLALLGKKAGEIARVRLKDREIEYKIKKIH